MCILTAKSTHASMSTEHRCPVGSCTRTISPKYKSCYAHKDTVLLAICESCKVPFTGPIWQTKCVGCFSRRGGATLADLSGLLS